MLLRIDSTNGVPIYLQIAKEVKHSIAIGSVRPGEQLPSVREIAVQITVNPNTAAKAYRELEAQGIVEIRRGTGAFVSEKTSGLSLRYKRRLVGELIDRALDEAWRMRMGEEETMRLFDERAEIFRKERKKQEEEDE